MTLNIDSLLNSQKPIADQDISVEWGQAIEADIRTLDNRTNGTVAGVGNGSTGTVGYGSYTGDDTSWAGTKVNCAVYDLDGKLYPNNTTFFDGALLYDSGSTYDNWVGSFSYTSLPFSFNTTTLAGGEVTVFGDFPHGTPVITAEYSDDNGSSWAALSGTQTGWLPLTGTTLTFDAAPMTDVRFTVTVPQASTGVPASLTSYALSLVGNGYGETLVTDIPIDGSYITYTLPYPVAPGAAFFPFFQADQRLRADVSELTATGCRVQLVTDDGAYTPMNGRGLLIVSLG